MKKSILILLFLAIMLLAGCGRETPEKVIAVWQSSTCFWEPSDLTDFKN